LIYKGLKVILFPLNHPQSFFRRRFLIMYLPEDPVFSTSGQSARLEKKLLPHKAFIGSISFGKSFFSSRALCPGVLKTGSSGSHYDLKCISK
jgi:hypothetical protein